MDHGLDPWLEDMRRRMLDIARRRVPADEAEDLVQSARRRVIDGSVDTDRVAGSLESMDAESRVRTIEEGLAELAAADGNCGRYLWRMADETPARDLARDEGIETHALYQRLYRCRRKLREILRRKGVLP